MQRHELHPANELQICQPQNTNEEQMLEILWTKWVDYWLTKLVRFAQQKPEGSFVHAYTIQTNGDPYLTRVLFRRMFGKRLMIHYIHRKDNERELHNHPWDKSISLIVTGGYMEERMMDGVKGLRWRFAGQFNRLDKKDLHRIIFVHKPTWTLFLAGERQIIDGMDWGFLDEETGKMIDRKIFIARIGSKRA
jgi:hypothetical protein